MKNKEQDETKECSHCYKNSSLIKKYEQLIALYRKKQRKELNDLSRLSNVNSNNSSLVSFSLLAIHKLFQTLNSVLIKRYSSVLYSLNRKSSKKYVLLCLTNRIGKNAKLKAFKGILAKATSNTLQQKTLCNALSRIHHNKLEKSFKTLKEHFRISQTAELIQNNMGKKNQIQQKIQNSLNDLKDKVKYPIYDQLNSKKNMELEIQNNKLKLQNKFLRESLVQSNRRQQKENEKKKRSLEMLAQQIYEKNQLIFELQSSIRIYEQKQQKNENVLDDDFYSLKKQIQHLEKIRDKYENDYIKLRDRFESKTKQFQNLTNEMEQMRKKNIKILEQNFSLKQKIKQSLYSEEQLKQTLDRLTCKLKRINILEKELCSGNQVKEKGENLIKSQLILDFLANITDADYKIHGEKLFDMEQLDFLQEHRSNWLDKIAEQENYIPRKNKKEQFNHSDIQLQGQLSESLFDTILEPPPSNTKISNLKLIELEIQKNNKIQIIAELKQKLMHVRAVVLNLLKSFQLEVIRGESEHILSILNNVFEYSEEERSSIIFKKRKLFGLI